jgi:hypothetical protein
MASADVWCKMLRRLYESADNQVFGILSSHPAAILAALRAWDNGIENVNLETVKGHGSAIMASSPVEYVRNAQLVSRDSDNGGTVCCCASTDFWVDHAEPLAVLEEVKQRVAWPLGELSEGCEFLVLVKRA